MEIAAGGGTLPRGWEALSIGTPATFAADAQERREGSSSIRINAAEVTRSYARSSDPIAVAGGEVIETSAWVKTKDVPAGQGTVILIAEFSDAGGKFIDVAKFDTADVSKPDWQQVSGSVEVPANAAQLRLRMGFSYSRGTCWWDDVRVTARSPLVCRIDPAELPTARLSPARTTLPVEILNRDGRTSKVVVGAGKQQAAAALSGKLSQRVEVPIVVGKAGKRSVEVSVAAADAPGGAGSPPIFTQTRAFTVPPPLALAPPSPTHWVVEDGPPAIEARTDVAIADAMRAGATLEVRIEDGDGQTRMKVGANDPKDGTGEFKLAAAPLPAGEYKLVAELRPKAGKPIRAEQPWRVIHREQAKVTLNEAGYPVYEGKAILPLGIFNGARFEEQAKAGFTVTHAYNAARILPDPFNADQVAFNYIENTHRHGMKILFMIPIKEAIEGDFEAVRRRVRLLRNHPALLAWDEEEGFARGDFKPDTLKKIKSIIDEEDPHHPFMVGDARDVIGRARGKPDFFPDAEMDLGMWWWYPFPLKQRAGNALEGEDGNLAGGRWDVLTPPYFLTSASTKKPIWVGIQSYKKPAADARYPTPDEYRAQAYLALVSGAKGLMWYGGSVTGGLFLKPDEGHWPEVQKLVREIRDRETFFLSPTIEGPAITPAEAPVAAMIKRRPDGRELLVAVNRGPDALDITIGEKNVRLEPYGVLVEERTK